jgi:hypothetical protein
LAFNAKIKMLILILIITWDRIPLNTY